MTSPETLLEHSNWLRRLAAGLVGDGALADDVVQDTWLAALQRPPDLERPVRPWLARVVRNAARFRWRSDANRAAREQAVAALDEDATPTSEELLARHELQQLLARLVGELDEPFRATILLRYAEGLAPTQIARRLGIPASTVRWRLKEALERLRCGLDTAHRGDRKAWLLALVPLVLLPRTSRAAPAAVAVAVTIVAIAIIGVLVLTRSRDHAPTLARPDRSLAIAARAPHHKAHMVDTPGWLAQEGAPPRHLAGRVVRDTTPVANALVRLTSEAAPPIEQHTGLDGRFDFGVQSANAVTLGAAAPDALAAIRHLDLRDPTTPVDNVELVLADCVGRLHGHVTDAGGTPIAHAQLLREDAIGTETDAKGAYELCLLSTAALMKQVEVVVRADGYGAIALGVAPSGHVRRDFVLTPDAVITGKAVADAPVANAKIWIEPERENFRSSDERPARLVVATDADGRFRISSASGGTYRIGGEARGMIAVQSIVAVDAGATVDVPVHLVAAAIVRGRVVAGGAPVAGARVAINQGGVVIRHDDPGRDSIAAGDAITQADGTFVFDGVPVGEVSFTASPMRVTAPLTTTLVAGDHNVILLDTQSLGRIRGVVRRHGVVVPFARVGLNGPSRQGVTADLSGYYEVAGLEPGTYGFYSDDGRRGAFAASAEVLELRLGETRELDIELVWGAQIAGVVVDGAGLPVAGAHVRVVGDAVEEGRCVTDPRGAFVCARLQPGVAYRVAVYPSDAITAPFPFVGSAPASVRAADGAGVVIRLAIDPHVATIAGTVVDEDGAPVADARVRASIEGVENNGWLHIPTVATDASGRFELNELTPGRYDVEAETLDGARRTDRVIIAGVNDATIVLVRPACVAPGAALEPKTKPTSPIIWDDRIELIGWTVPATAQRDEVIEVVLVFRVLKSVTHAWSLFAHFDGEKRRQSADHDPLGGKCPMSAWKPGEVLVDRFMTKLPVAGSFGLRIGFYAGGGDGPWKNLAFSAGGDGILGAQLATVLVE